MSAHDKDYDMSKGWQARRSRQIDLAIAVARAVTPPGVVWTAADLAEVCGCSRQAIQLIERKALRKLRAALARRGVKEFPC